MSGTIRPAKALRTPNVGGSVVKTRGKLAADVGANREMVLADPWFILGSVNRIPTVKPIYFPTKYADPLLHRWFDRG
jgi:hypothetical protein